MPFRVLIADDIGVVRSVVRNIFISLGLEEGNVIEAANGAAALKAVREEDLGLVVTDWNMPQASGIEVLQAVREENESLPVLFLTSNNMRDEVLLAVAAGADDYILKPFTHVQVTEKLSYWLRHAQTNAAAATTAEASE